MFCFLQLCLDRNPHAFKPKVGQNKSVSPSRFGASFFFFFFLAGGGSGERGNKGGRVRIGGGG